MKTTALLLAVLVSMSVARATERPNVLFIFNDDHRSDTIAALGNPIIETPNLDRLCRQGVGFNRAYMQGGFNGATCVPSRAMLIYPVRATRRMRECRRRTFCRSTRSTMARC